MTKEMLVEVTKSSRGNTMLKVDNFKFFHERKGRDGLHYWRCVRSLCTAKFYTDEALNVVTHDSNSFQHNHVLSRTKLVKRLVIKEIKKVVALKGDSMPTAELKKYALNYLNQAFASTLKPAEMSSVKKGIHSYCKYYRSPRNMTTGLESPDTSQNKTSPYSTQSQNEHRRLKICKAVEQGMYYDYFADQIAVTSSSESDAESIGEEEKDQDSLKPLETLKSSNDPDLDFMGNVESKFAAAMFQTDGDPQLQNADSKIYPMATVIQPMGSQFSGGTVSTKPDFQESFYRNQGWPEILIKEELHTQDDSQTSVHLGFDPLGSAFAYQHIPQGEDMRLSPPGSAFSFVGAAGPPLLIPRLEPMVSDEQIVDLTAADLSQHRDFLARDDSLEDDEDHKFCLSLIPMFRRLSTSDKSMIKAQIHQLMNWKLKNVA